jgi:hypothetical protein
MMKKMIYRITALTSLFVLLLTTQMQASHIIGTELTYSCVSANQYNVRLVLYADCAGLSAGISQTVSFTSSGCTSFSASLPIVSGYPLEVTANCPSSLTTCSGGSIPGIKMYVFSANVNLPSSVCTDWQISWSSCCRPGTISNISNPSATNLFTSTKLDVTQSPCNNSPSFVNIEPQFSSCLNDTAYINFGANDADGDSLVYSLGAASQSAGSFVSYNPPFSGANPFSGTTLLNHATGILTLIPATLQIGVVVVKIEEYRNGNKIGQIQRELMISIYNCTNNSSPIVSAVNGNMMNGGNLALSINQGLPFTLNASTYDPEVAAGSQTMTASWSNLPANATTTGTVLNWTPSSAEVGTHNIYLTLSDNNCPLNAVNTYNFIIHVMGVVSTNQSPIAVDNYYSVNSALPIAFDVLTNDADPDGNNLTLNSIFPISMATGATVTVSGNQIIFTPNLINGAIDVFDYMVCDDGNPSLCDTARVYVLVDYLSYPIAVTMAAGTTADIYLDTTALSGIGSVTLSGSSFNNATILNTNVAAGSLTLKADSIATSSATFLICDNTGFCVQNIVSLTVEQGVWPGDTDTSQLVNHFDLLNIGFAYGNTGPARNPASIAWNGYLTPDWTKKMPNSQVNFKHIDCNGDGIVGLQDTVAISNNWNLSYTYNKSGAGIIPLYIDTLTPTSINASLPIMLGTSSIPANDIYGIAFTVAYDTSLIEPNTIDVSIDTSWLGTAWSDLIKVHKDFYAAGMVQIAITRTDGVDADGVGRIGALNFTIQDDIMQRGFIKFPFEIIDVRAIDALEQELSINPLATDITLIASNTNQLYLESFISVFPNPVSDVLKIQSEDLIMEQIILTNIGGQVVKSEIIHQHQAELYMQNLPNGLYTLSILTNKGLVHKKINIVK